MKMICHYELGGEARSVKGSNLVDFKDGFWLDNSLLLVPRVPSHELMRRVWVPPARILHVERTK